MPTPARLATASRLASGAAGAEHGLGRLQHALAIAHRVGAGLAGLVGVVVHADNVDHELVRLNPC